MPTNFSTVLFTILNLALLVAIIGVIIIAIKGFRNFLSRNNEMDKKLDKILKKLEDR